MVTSPYEWNFLRVDKDIQTKKLVYTQFFISGFAYILPINSLNLMNHYMVVQFCFSLKFSKMVVHVYMGIYLIDWI